MMQVGQLWFHQHLPNKDKQIVNVTDKFLCKGGHQLHQEVKW